ncbi:MAG: LytTR family DNA-binding domain-containing protein [Bacteroidales bacterium]|nr:LytTR family DNA-binding domain-containing protein [Bacteroidales bacterium]
MTCIIVDDEPLAVRQLETMVARSADLELRGSYTDSIAALEALQKEPVDLLFLDIQMPDLNGMELAHAIDNQRTRIIFTTAFKDYAYESYEVNALDYLLKPIRYVKFQAAVEKARAVISVNTSTSTTEAQTEPTSVFLRVDGEMRQLSFDRIVCVEAMKDYLKIYVEDEASPWVTHMTLSAAEQMLPPSRFMRIHRSYIISLRHIRSIDRNDCVYIGSLIIRVTEAYKDNFARYLEQHGVK